MYAIINLMKIVPKNLISYLLGFITRIALPSVIQDVINSAFVKLFKINMEEAEKDIKSYKSIEDIFTRHIKEDARSINSDLVSPSDGTLCVSLPTQRDRAVQAKGLTYSLEELVFGMSGCQDKEFNPGWYTTVYLAPHNYHRVHTPIAGKLKSIQYIPGELWPVNMPFVKHLPYLFTRNERLVFEIEHETGGCAYIVMVGALNVGRMESLHMPELTTNNFSRMFGASAIHKAMEQGTNLKAGDELGVFMLGSTAVCVFDEKISNHFKIQPIAFTNKTVQLGHSLLQ